MALAVLYTRAFYGIDAPLVTVETHITTGLPRFAIVGLPEKVVNESKDRVRSALQNCQFEFPPRKITVNLGPADLPKEGGRYDLPIAIGILAAQSKIPTAALGEYEFAAELGLSGALRPIKACLLAAHATKQAGRKLIVAEENLNELHLLAGGEIYGAKHLLEVVGHLTGQALLCPFKPGVIQCKSVNRLDYSDVRGQFHAKRAMTIAAAGGHSIVMTGPPGTGKSMLAQRIETILPEMTAGEMLEVARILAASTWLSSQSLLSSRPFRSPHHTLSAVALVGGGNPPTPGEISLAHSGVLFLDELPEFSRASLEALREPLETGCISISRASRKVSFPARFQLVAAMNPCPCGYLSDPCGRCNCTPNQIEYYRKKLSGPLFDRIDMHVEVPPLSSALLSNPIPESVALNSESMRTSVMNARLLQQERQEMINAYLPFRMMEKYCELSQGEMEWLKLAFDKLRMSARSYHRLLRVARTIADLEGQSEIQIHHLKEAVSYRAKAAVDFHLA